MQAKTFAILTTLVILGLVIDLIRREKMTFKYALAWFAGCAIALVFAIQDSWLISVSKALGFSLPSNFIFFILLAFFILLSLLLTIHLNEQNSRSEALAQSVALLQNELDHLKEEKRQSGS